MQTANPETHHFILLHDFIMAVSMQYECMWPAPDLTDEQFSFSSTSSRLLVSLNLMMRQPAMLMSLYGVELLQDIRTISAFTNVSWLHVPSVEKLFNHWAHFTGE